jgi:hypothetical protein
VMFFNLKERNSLAWNDNVCLGNVTPIHTVFISFNC